MASVMPASRVELLHHLEELTGQSFHTRADVHKFVIDMDAQKAAKQQRSANGWRAVKTTTLLVLLILSFVQFYLADSLLQTVSLRELTFFVPVKADLHS
jgi:hypothetical protein